MKCDFCLFFRGTKVSFVHKIYIRMTCIFKLENSTAAMWSDRDKKLTMHGLRCVDISLESVG